MGELQLVRSAAAESRIAKRKPNLSIAQVAEVLGVSTRQVLRYINDGDLKAYDMRGRRATRAEWRIRPEDLDEFERSRFQGVK